MRKGALARGGCGRTLTQQQRRRVRRTGGRCLVLHAAPSLLCVLRGPCALTLPSEAEMALKLSQGADMSADQPQGVDAAAESAALHARMAGG